MESDGPISSHLSFFFPSVRNTLRYPGSLFFFLSPHCERSPADVAKEAETLFQADRRIARRGEALHPSSRAVAGRKSLVPFFFFLLSCHPGGRASPVSSFSWGGEKYMMEAFRSLLSVTYVQRPDSLPFFSPPPLSTRKSLFRRSSSFSFLGQPQIGVKDHKELYLFLPLLVSLG